jgi:hypothetical protein
MKSLKVLALMLAFILVAGYAFSEGGSEKGTTAATTGPQYGGTLTFSFWQWYEAKKLGCYFGILDRRI